MPDSRNILVSNEFTDMECRKNSVLSMLGMSTDNLDKISEKLEQYKYVSSMLLLNVGSYIRWIPIKDLQSHSKIEHEVKLTTGGIVISIVDVYGKVHIKCKNNYGNIYQLNIMHNIIFQKLTDQEKVIMDAVRFIKN